MFTMPKTAETVEFPMAYMHFKTVAIYIKMKKIDIFIRTKEIKNFR